MRSLKIIFLTLAAFIWQTIGTPDAEDCDAKVTQSLKMITEDEHLVMISMLSAVLQSNQEMKKMCTDSIHTTLASLSEITSRIQVLEEQTSSLPSLSSSVSSGFGKIEQLLIENRTNDELQESSKAILRKIENLTTASVDSFSTLDSKVDDFKGQLMSGKSELLSVYEQCKKPNSCFCTAYLMAHLTIDKTRVFKTTSNAAYYFTSTKAHWNEARQKCLSFGMDLVTFKTENELYLLATNLKKSLSPHSKYFWVSASDIGHRVGQYLWINNEKVNATLWAAGQPRNSGHFQSENTCVNMNTGEGKLEVSSCISDSLVICELPVNAIDCF